MLFCTDLIPDPEPVIPGRGHAPEHPDDCSLGSVVLPDAGRTRVAVQRPGGHVACVRIGDVPEPLRTELLEHLGAQGAAAPWLEDGTPGVYLFDLQTFLLRRQQRLTPSRTEQRCD